ncbi:hypothetical protein RJT34_18695 [Clitoria ternatea]|uniref:Pentatricopeptide repeat-containing protein n=1 Tax=Clitoria ternatea TaxID=43366 RepID=A0AAN9JDJ9_CLITE
MLCRTRHAAFSINTTTISFLFKPFASSSSSSSKTRPNFTNPQSNFTKPTSFPPPIPRLSHVSLISNLVSCSNDADMLRVLSCHTRDLTSDLVLRVLMCYKQLGRAKTLKFFSLAGTQLGFQLDDSVVEYMADFLGRRKLFDDIKGLFMTVSFHKGRVSTKALSICIRFLGRQGRVKEALSLFEEMETVFRCKPDNLVYNNMLYVLCKKQSSSEMIELALSIFHEIESPDMYSCSNMIAGLCKLGRLETALEIFGQMEKIGVLPTRSAVNILIVELCLMSAKEGTVEKVRVGNTRRPYTILVPNLGRNVRQVASWPNQVPLKADIQRSGLIGTSLENVSNQVGPSDCGGVPWATPFDHFQPHSKQARSSGAINLAVSVFWAVCNAGLLPSSFVVVKLLLELCRLGNTEEAVQVLRIAEERKLTCVQDGYCIVIKAMCENRRVEEAGSLFGRMLATGLKPKLVVYNSVISMLCKLGKLNNATRVFEIMNKNRCLPDSFTYIALIHAHGEGKNWKVAYDLLMEMLGLGWIPHFHTYNLVECLLRENDRLDLCVKLERKLENQRLQKLCKRGQLDAAYEKAKSMLEKGIPLSAYARDTFERMFQKHGKLKIARQLLDKVESERVQKPKEINRT